MTATFPGVALANAATFCGESHTVLGNADLRCIHSAGRGVGRSLTVLAPVLDKMVVNPKRSDVITLLVWTARRPEEFIDEYTDEVHAQLVALIAPLRALVQGINGEYAAALETPVRAIGAKLYTMCEEALYAVCYVASDLLYKEKTQYAGGHWFTAEHALARAWSDYLDLR